MLAWLVGATHSGVSRSVLQQRAGIPRASSVLTALSLQVDKINHQVAACMVGPFTQVHPAALLRFLPGGFCNFKRKLQAVLAVTGADAFVPCADEAVRPEAPGQDGGRAQAPAGV